MAHAWVEVWFGPYGWIEFDPTSKTLAPGETVEFSSGFDPAKFENLLSEILRNKSLPAMQAMEGSASSEQSRNVFEEAADFIKAFWPLVLLALYILVIALGRLYKAVTLSIAKGRRRSILQWSGILEACHDLGFRRGHNESTLELAKRFEKNTNIKLEELASLYERACFDPAWSGEDTGAFESKAKETIKIIQRRTPAFRKARSLMDPRRAIWRLR
jgi:hypothetical protein